MRNEYRELVKSKMFEVLVKHEYTDCDLGCGPDQDDLDLLEALTSEAVLGPLAVPVVQSVLAQLCDLNDLIELDAFINDLEAEVADARRAYGLGGPEEVECEASW